MNPFTRFLSQWSADGPAQLSAFIAHWDALEGLVVRVYRRKVSVDDAQA
ncbi:MAG: hypothetical protein IAE79_10840 [Anaerolinea sp.]|nr:hypothetical protein [Anaerolinea sp.]